MWVCVLIKLLDDVKCSGQTAVSEMPLQSCPHGYSVWVFHLAVISWRVQVQIQVQVHKVEVCYRRVHKGRPLL